jgi:hypothetical protein
VGRRQAGVVACRHIAEPHIPPVGLRGGAATREHREQRVSIVPQKAPYFPPPDRRVGHQKAKVWINSRNISDKEAHTAPTPPLSYLSPTIVERGISSSINRSGDQSPCRPRIGSQRLPYAGSPKESSDVTPSLRTTTGRGEMDLMAHQILARRTPYMPRCIPSLVQEM